MAVDHRSPDRDHEQGGPPPPRAPFDQLLTEHFAKFQRDGTGYSVLYLDIDHFKSINDTHGHTDGDAILQQLAATCVAVLRPYDMVPRRLGGEEFAVLLPGSDNRRRRSGGRNDFRRAISSDAGQGPKQERCRSPSASAVSQSGRGDADGFETAQARRLGALLRKKMPVATA